jgi:ubiquinone/menaquinone biosynthesis C-methylase UbiE
MTGSQNSNIKRYDLGLGTTYERLSLNNYLRTLIDSYVITSVLEGPFDGMKGIVGINSLIFGKYGIKTTVCLPTQEAIEFATMIWGKERCLNKVTFIHNSKLSLEDITGSFELVWNFAVLPHVPDYKKVIDEMIKLSHRYILIFVSNKLNYGFWLHYAYHKLTKEQWDHGDIWLMNTKLIADYLRAQGLKIIDRPFIDVPWWPDLDLPIGDILTSFMPFLRRYVQHTKHAKYYKWSIENLPYFGFNEDMIRIMAKHGFIERSKINVIKYIFAHHQGVLATKR